MAASILRLPVLLWLACALALMSKATGQTRTTPEADPDHVSTPPPPVVEDEVPDGLSGDDWSNVRDAYEAGRHAVYEVEGGYQARNPGQQWLTRFDGRGFTVEPDAGSWTWGLELQSYGFPGTEQPVTKAESMSAEGGRVAYAWDTILEEWFINDRRGLEHGYTVKQRPPQNGNFEECLLTFTLDVRGELHPEVSPDGRGIRFLDDNGAVALTYTGLSVFDAERQKLDASLERVNNGVRLSIDERTARYPLTIDPIAQQAYLKASNTDPYDHFGMSVAVSGDTVVIGAFGEASNAPGVNGDQGDNSASNAGAAYVFVRSGTSWSQEAYLKASNPDGNGSSPPYGDAFGFSVAVSGDTAVIGAYGEASNATGVNGNQSDNSASHAGAAYVFVRNGTNWSQEAYLKASNAEAGDQFGRSVAVSDNTVVIGADEEASSATGVNGDQSDNSADKAGAVYVFVRNGTDWSQEAYVKASNTDGGDGFAHWVALSGDTLVAGARSEDSSSSGVNGDQSDNSASAAGAVYVFVRNGTNWSQEAYLKASNTDHHDYFGQRLAISDDTVIIGAGGEDSNATGVNGNQSDNSLDEAGAAYVFVRNGTTWSQEAYLKASNTEWGDQFAQSVAVSGDIVVVGAEQESSGATGVNGDQSDNSAAYSGAAYVFVREGTSWNQQAYLKASNTDPLDHFATVAVSGETAVIGAWGEHSNATGVNGNQSDNSAGGAGAAYVFDLPVALGVPFCFGDPGSGTPCPCANNNDGSVPGSGCANGSSFSGAQLTGSGMASVSADTLVLSTTGLHPNNTGLYFQANNRVNNGDGNVFGDGLRCAGGGLIRLQVRTSDGAGTSSSTIAIGARGGVAPGDTKRYQCWYRDNSGNQPCGVGVNDFNLSNGYEITWLP